ncbi:MAG: phosphoribosylglycinamide formyltransferase [candidate division Zixibacteria bacterium]|nr:phosphoribosylglycinamide formyltransferase [candidate division Zixibacteria bacterium]
MTNAKHQPLRIAVFASGEGTDLQAIIDACKDGRIDGRVVLVISNNRNAGALERGRTVGAKAVHWSETRAGSAQRFETELRYILRDAQPELIVLAGYMKLVPQAIVKEYEGRMLNVHPALLPKFGGKGYYGMRVHEAVLEAGETESGATVHFVDAEYDHGVTFMQESVPVQPDDTPESLRARVLELEHRLLPAAMARFIELRRAGKDPYQEAMNATPTIGRD